MFMLSGQIWFLLRNEVFKFCLIIKILLSYVFFFIAVGITEVHLGHLTRDLRIKKANIKCNAKQLSCPKNDCHALYISKTGLG